MEKKWNNIDEFLSILKEKREKNEAFYFRAKIISNADRTELIEVLNDEEKTVKIKVSAIPEKGKANKAIIHFFKKNYKLKAKILSGAQHTLKLIMVKP